MSAEATPAPAEVDPAIANPPGMGGTSTEEEVRADGVGATEGAEEESQESEGTSPEGETERTGEEPAPREEARDSERDARAAELEQRVAESDAIARTILADPARIREYRKWVQVDSGGNADDSLADLAQEIGRRFPQEADREAVLAFVNPLVRVVSDLREQVRAMRPALERTSRVASSREYADALEAGGVSRETQRTPEFRKFVARERQDPDFARDLDRRAAYAGKTLARAWAARSVTRSGRAAEHRRTTDLRDGRLHAAATPSRSGAEKVHLVDTTKSDWSAQLLAEVIKNPGMIDPNTGRLRGLQYAKPK